MRGKGVRSGTFLNFSGITPAYAGKSGNTEYSYDITRDHPRLCGEKAHFADQKRNMKGSPPPMRGKGCRTQNAAGQPGITPAYAGKREIL